jgi:hypothetical protein
MKNILGNIFTLIPYIQMAMQKAQAIKKASGADKKKVAIEEFTATAIQAIEAGAGKDVIEDSLVTAAAGSVMDALKAFENAVADAKRRHGLASA